ncbi:hypothetical protein BJX68DRAFT_148880 [Aspergillus pseudodeflectus]|uniref:Uncharacterized protein n=1 Tax=Aspergillus pseudodeflectus TaxID=176178 RepID=A0ABR4JWR5_9EURO
MTDKRAQHPARQLYRCEIYDNTQHTIPPARLFGLPAMTTGRSEASSGRKKNNTCADKIFCLLSLIILYKATYRLIIFNPTCLFTLALL